MLSQTEILKKLRNVLFNTLNMYISEIIELRNDCIYNPSNDDLEFRYDDGTLMNDYFDSRKNLYEAANYFFGTSKEVNEFISKINNFYLNESSGSVQAVELERILESIPKNDYIVQIDKNSIKYII